MKIGHQGVWKTSMETYGTSYKWGTVFFPNQLKEETYLLYAFVRAADNIVDDRATARHEAKKELVTMRMRFWQHLDNATLEDGDELCKGFAGLCRQKEIPKERVDQFFEAMLADCGESIYQTYEELQEYMVGSAEVVGLMMCKLIGYDAAHQEEVFARARLLGEAMQYTNFLRDIKEDRLQYNRLYMPLDRLQQFDCNHAVVKRYCEGTDRDANWDRFMAHQIIVTKQLYREANQGIALLDKQGRFAVQVASTMYEAILDKIWKNQYDVFDRDAHTSKWEKFLAFSRTVMHHDF